MSAAIIGEKLNTKKPTASNMGISAKVQAKPMKGTIRPVISNWNIKVRLLTDKSIIANNDVRVSETVMFSLIIWACWK